MIHDQIVTLKREQPAFGVKRIAHTLRRLFHLPTSPETVRKTLHREKLIKPRKNKTHSNPSKPRFFERSMPNQMWQSDIFPFKLGGEAVRPPEWLGPGGYAYLIGFIDDHSRYITALEIFRSQTADNLLEVFRRGVGAHGVPMEMLAAELELAVTGKFFWNQTRDLASRYQFEPLTTTALATGALVATRLRALFAKHGPPLIVKLDNHGNLNNAPVAGALGECLVIPLNSPPYYPPYNGNMEKGQDEFQRTLKSKFLGRKWPAMTAEEAVNVLQLGSEVAAHDLNQWPRPCLKDVSARHCFEVGKRNLRYYDRNQRREVFEEMRAMASLAMAETGLTGQRAAGAAWRLAVETWLRREGHITVSVNGKVLPYYA